MNSYTLEKKFLSIGLIFGLIMVFLVPPFQAPDEDSHFKKSFLVSTFHIFPQVSPEGKVGNYMPQSILDFENKHRYLIGDLNSRYSYKDQYMDSYTSVDKGNDTFIEYSTSRTNPLLFIPQAIGMLTYKIVADNPILHNSDTISPINYLYAGRIVNLFFFLFCCYWAIKIIPFMKNVLFLLCLMPMTMSLASSLSYDTMIIGCIMLFTAWIFNLAYSEEVKVIEKKYLYFLILFSIVLIQFKQVYYPLLLLFTLIPSMKFESKKQKYYWLLIALASGVVAFVMWSLFTRLLLGVVPVSTDSNALEQVKFIVSSPLSYAHVLFNTFVVNFQYYAVSFIGNLGWLDTNFPFVFIWFYALLIIAAAIFDDSKLKVKWAHKGLIVGLFLIICTLLETALYVTWTSISEIGGIGYEVVSGVQGRYFIPVGILLLILFKVSSPKINARLSGASKMFSYVTPQIVTFSMAYTIIIVLLRYWIPSP